jgi:hypothetical protein
MNVGEAIANEIALNRVALGFPIDQIPVVPWPQYFGYATAEGQELNETAREAGDDPDEWYVAENPVDVMQVTEFWYSPSAANPKLRRSETYVRDIHRIVTLCRENKAYIPPSWLEHEQATALAYRLGLPIAE